MEKFLKTILVAATPFLVTACNSSSEEEAPPKKMAPKTVASVTPSQILAIASGGIDASGESGPFPLAISGGDGFQANPIEDASFATLINSVRSAYGEKPVQFNAKLNTAAQAHSNDMLAQDYFSHTGKDGSTVGTRATAAGYVWTAIGENIAQGQKNENLAMNSWISSPGHQRNNVNPAFKEFGLGRAGTGSNTRWTLVLGAR